MTQVQLNIADEQIEEIRRRAAERGLSTLEAHLQNLVDEDLSIDEDLEALLLSRVNGPFIDWNEEEAKKLQAEVAEDLKKKVFAMKLSVQVSAEARADIRAIAKYIANDSLDAAERFAPAFIATLRGLAEFPGKGSHSTCG